MSIFHITKGSIHRTLTRRERWTRAVLVEKDGCSQPVRRKFRLGFVFVREEKRNLSNSFPDKFAIPAAYIIPYAAARSRRTRKIYTYTYLRCPYTYMCAHLSQSSCCRGRCFQSRLYLVELKSTLPPSSLQKEPSEIHPPLLTSPPVFLVFFFFTAIPSPFQGSLRNVAEV